MRTLHNRDYTGTVIGTDYAGYFGAAGASLNTTYTATYVFNTSVPGAYNYNNGSTFRTDGGSAINGYPTTPSISANLTLTTKLSLKLSRALIWDIF